MSDKEERPIQRLCVDTKKFSELLIALMECIESGEFDYANACIHKLTLPDGKRCQIILEIEQEDDKGKFPSELEPSPIYSCIETEH